MNKVLEKQATLLLAYLGFRPESKAVHYLSGMLAEAVDAPAPGPELWGRVALRNGCKKETVRAAVSKELHRIYELDPLRLSILARDREVFFVCPRTGEFIAMAAKWLTRYEFVMGCEERQPKETDVVERKGPMFPHP